MILVPTPPVLMAELTRTTIRWSGHGFLMRGEPVMLPSWEAVVEVGAWQWEMAMRRMECKLEVMLIWIDESEVTMWQR